VERIRKEAIMKLITDEQRLQLLDNGVAAANGADGQLSAH
jgi:hypothetical protein